MAKPSKTEHLKGEEQPKYEKLFWNHAEKKQVKGKFIRFVSTQYGIAVELTSCLVSCVPVVINSLFASVAKTIKAGDEVEITLTGKEGRTNLYSLKVNGDEIEQKRGLRTARQDQVAEFFGIATEDDLPF